MSLQDLGHKTYKKLGDIVDMATDEEKYIFVTNKECKLIYIHLENKDAKGKTIREEFSVNHPKDTNSTYLTCLKVSPNGKYLIGF